MSLADFAPQRRDVMLNGATLFSIRGLSFVEFETLIRTHFPDLDGIADLWDKFGDASFDDIAPFFVALTSQAPGLVANIIALAADEPHAAPQAIKIPAPAQIKILLDITDLTFNEVGGVKKALAHVAPMVLKKVEKVMATRGKTPKSVGQSASTSAFGGT